MVPAGTQAILPYGLVAPDKHPTSHRDVRTILRTHFHSSMVSRWLIDHSLENAPQRMLARINGWPLPLSVYPLSSAAVRPSVIFIAQR